MKQLIFLLYMIYILYIIEASTADERMLHAKR